MAANRTWLVDATICSTMAGATATITSLEIPNILTPLLNRKLKELAAFHEGMRSSTDNARLLYSTCIWRPPRGTLEAGIDAR